MARAPVRVFPPTVVWREGNGGRNGDLFSFNYRKRALRVAKKLSGDGVVVVVAA